MWVNKARPICKEQSLTTKSRLKTRQALHNPPGLKLFKPSFDGRNPQVIPEMRSWRQQDCKKPTHTSACRCDKLLQKVPTIFTNVCFFSTPALAPVPTRWTSSGLLLAFSFWIPSEVVTKRNLPPPTCRSKIWSTYYLRGKRMITSTPRSLSQSQPLLFSPLLHRGWAAIIPSNKRPHHHLNWGNTTRRAGRTVHTNKRLLSEP